MGITSRENDDEEDIEMKKVKDVKQDTDVTYQYVRILKKKELSLVEKT